ncbi:MAG TPA: SIMPL domain-containing protein, partial [Caulobacteraceae bacterium]|nr:SIMPL domain-containing protein [Caulobacteraceae bacterium]
MRTAALLALSCLTLAACEREPDPRGVDRGEVLLQVVATGKSETRPDEARFTAGVQTIAASADAASTRNNEVMNRVTAALQRLGVKE